MTRVAVDIAILALYLLLSYVLLIPQQVEGARGSVSMPGRQLIAWLCQLGLVSDAILPQQHRPFSLGQHRSILLGEINSTLQGCPFCGEEDNNDTT